MALSRKYAALPDLDSAPDIYETPELTDGGSTVPTSTAAQSAPPSSRRSSASDSGLSQDETRNISRSHLQPSQARHLFSPSQVDARDVDFSDRIAAKKASYKTSTRRRRKNADGTELGDLSDEEDESLERKLARLKREIEEVKQEAEHRKQEREVSGDKEVVDNEGDFEQLSQLLRTVEINASLNDRSAQSKLSQSLSKSLKAHTSPDPQGGHPAEGLPINGNNYSLIYSASQDLGSKHTLALAASFESRLTALERLLGLPALLPDSSPKPILPILNRISAQVNTLTTTSASSLDALRHRIRQLTNDAETLSQSRQTARDASGSRGEDANGTVATKQAIDEESQAAKVTALYGTLPTIESIAPLLPSLLARLHSLRELHAEAATASQDLETLEQRTEEIGKEVKNWKEGLGKVENVINRVEEEWKANANVIETWVKGLETRVQKLGD